MAVSDFIEKQSNAAFGFYDEHLRDGLERFDTMLDGVEREPADIARVEAEFVRGTDFTAEVGEPATVAVAAARTADEARTATLDSSPRIEFVHYGRVHLDFLRNFSSDEALDDLEERDLAGLVGSRAVFFRAALQREAVFVSSLVRSVKLALEEKDDKEGELADALTLMGDLAGMGARTTATTATSSDLDPFYGKIKDEVWPLLKKEEVKLGELHRAGRVLHEVRANLRVYLREQLAAPDPSPPAPKPGLLGDLPYVGPVPIPEAIGKAVKYAQVITGKLFDVQVALIYDLTLAMQPVIEDVSSQISLDLIRSKRTPIFQPWLLPPSERPVEDDTDDAAAGEEEPPFAALEHPLKGKDVFGKDLGKIGEGKVEDLNAWLNKAAEKPLEAIDFLSQKRPVSPGARYIQQLFHGQPVADGAYYGSGHFGRIAVGSLGRAIHDGSTGADIPDFMKGVVAKVVENVFAVCAEFVRATYDQVCRMSPEEDISPAQLVVAGRNHLVQSAVDIVFDLIPQVREWIDDNAVIELPKPPRGFHWPGGARLTTDPIFDELTARLQESLARYLDPVADYTMSRMAARFNATRAWAGASFCMEAHLAHLPMELALTFRGLFEPLWTFVVDTVLGAIKSAVAKALGPAAAAYGVVDDTVDTVLHHVDRARVHAKQAVQYAERVEKEAGEMKEAVGDVKWPWKKGGRDTWKKAGKETGGLIKALGKADFDYKEEPEEEVTPPPDASFLAERPPLATGAFPSAEELAELREARLWDEAREPGTAFEIDEQAPSAAETAEESADDGAGDAGAEEGADDAAAGGHDASPSSGEGAVSTGGGASSGAEQAPRGERAAGLGHASPE
ncbi:MAG: hypothetical protein AAGA56_15300 [Myxococcota bacterium]